MLKKVTVIILSAMFLCPMTSFALDVGTTFPDIERHWAQENIALMVSEGIVDGYPDGNFYPENTITRGEFATLISRLLPELPSDYVFEQGGFLDVVLGLPHSAEPPYYTIPIYYLKELGIVTGDETGTFYPNEEITREDMAVIIVRLLENLGYQYPYAANGGLRFDDSSEVSEYAYYAVFNLTRRTDGIMTGYGQFLQDSYEFRPKTYATRAEATTIIARVFEACLQK